MVRRSDYIEVEFLNLGGRGWPEMVRVENGTSVSDFFYEKMGDVDPDDYQVRLNGVEIDVDEENGLQDKDNLTVTPKKIHGA